MKRPASLVPKSPQGARTGVPRTSKDAAIQLVRLEFDLGRLRRAIDQAERRCSADRATLAEKERQRRALLRILER